MSRVKFNVNTEYAYIQNFKILQGRPTDLTPLTHVEKAQEDPTGTFTKHQIERSVPIESLVKCKMQDNLEFLQWTKRFWDQYFPGGEYDAIARRKGQAGPPSSNGPSSSARTSAAGAAARRGTTPTTTGSAARPARAGVGASSALTQENTQLKETVAGLERERDFYFSKLRDIELLIQEAVEQDPEIEKDEGRLVKRIQGILYSTEVSLELRIWAMEMLRNVG